MRFRFQFSSIVAAFFVAASLALEGCGPGCRIHTNLVYDASHGGAGTFDEYVPPGEHDARPALVVIHEGAWRQGDKTEAMDYAPQMARGGLVVLSINYRLSGESPWPAQLDDCREAVRFFRKNASTLGIDAHRIGVLGASAGGHLSAMVALTDDPEAAPGFSHVSTFASIAGESDLTNPNGQSDEVEIMTELFGAPPPWNPELLRDASPVFHARKDVSALLIHGELDPEVFVNQSDALNAALTNAGAPVWYLRRHSWQHGNTLKDPRIIDLIVGFFKRHI